MIYSFKSGESFLVPFSNVPYVYNGTKFELIRGASCFAKFILEKQGLLDTMKDTLDYLFNPDETVEEMSISAKDIVEIRTEQSLNFFNKYFPFFSDVAYKNKKQLFVYTAFLDQLANDCYEYLEFKEPHIYNYVDAFSNIKTLSEYRDISVEEVETYKKELMDLLSVKKPNAYFAILFNAA